MVVLFCVFSSPSFSLYSSSSSSHPPLLLSFFFWTDNLILFVVIPFSIELNSLMSAKFVGYNLFSSDLETKQVISADDRKPIHKLNIVRPSKSMRCTVYTSVLRIQLGRRTLLLFIVCMTSMYMCARMCLFM